MTCRCACLLPSRRCSSCGARCPRPCWQTLTCWQVRAAAGRNAAQHLDCMIVCLDNAKVLHAAPPYSAAVFPLIPEAVGWHCSCASAWGPIACGWCPAAVLRRCDGLVVWAGGRAVHAAGGVGRCRLQRRAQHAQRHEPRVHPGRGAWQQGGRLDTWAVDRVVWTCNICCLLQRSCYTSTAMQHRRSPSATPACAAACFPKAL